MNSISPNKEVNRSPEQISETAPSKSVSKNKIKRFIISLQGLSYSFIKMAVKKVFEVVKNRGLIQSLVKSYERFEETIEGKKFIQIQTAILGKNLETTNPNRNKDLEELETQKSQLMKKILEDKEIQNLVADLVILKPFKFAVVMDQVRQKKCGQWISSKNLLNFPRTLIKFD